MSHSKSISVDFILVVCRVMLLLTLIDYKWTVVQPRPRTLIGSHTLTVTCDC